MIMEVRLFMTFYNLSIMGYINAGVCNLINEAIDIHTFVCTIYLDNIVFHPFLLDDTKTKIG